MPLHLWPHSSHSSFCSLPASAGLLTIPPIHQAFCMGALTLAFPSLSETLSSYRLLHKHFLTSVKWVYYLISLPPPHWLFSNKNENHQVFKLDICYVSLRSILQPPVCPTPRMAALCRLNHGVPCPLASDWVHPLLTGSSQSKAPPGGSEEWGEDGVCSVPLALSLAGCSTLDSPLHKTLFWALTAPVPSPRQGQGWW